MKINKEIKWIFFDVGGVLVDESKAKEKRINIILEVARKHNLHITREDILRFWPKASGMKGSLTENLAGLVLGNIRGKKAAISEIRRQWLSFFKEEKEIFFVRPEAKKVLGKLEKKYFLGLLSNQPLENKVKLRKAGLLKYFKQKRVSEDYNLKKPDPRFFEEVLRKTKADPEKAAMVDDNIERCLVSAKSLGMTTIWYKLEERKEMPEGVVDFTINTLDELLDIFL